MTSQSLSSTPGRTWEKSKSRSQRHTAWKSWWPSPKQYNLTSNSVTLTMSPCQHILHSKRSKSHTTAAFCCDALFATCMPCLDVFVCSAYRWSCVLHGSHKSHRFRGAGPYRLRPSISEHTGHRRLIRQTEHSLILLREMDWCDWMILLYVQLTAMCKNVNNPTLNCASCRASWMKASGLVLHFLIKPLPNSLNR